MADVNSADLALIVATGFVIVGVWLAGLTYLMWRRHLRMMKELAEKTEEKPKEEPPSQST